MEGKWQSNSQFQFVFNYLWKTIGMGTNDGNVTGPWVGIVKRTVVLNMKRQDGVVIFGGMSIFTDVL